MTDDHHNHEWWPSQCLIHYDQTQINWHNHAVDSSRLKNRVSTETQMNVCTSSDQNNLHLEADHMISDQTSKHFFHNQCVSQFPTYHPRCPSQDTIRMTPPSVRFTATCSQTSNQVTYICFLASPICPITGHIKMDDNPTSSSQTSTQHNKLWWLALSGCSAQTPLS